MPIHILDGFSSFLILQQRLNPSLHYLVEELDTASQPFPARWLLLFVQVPEFDQLGKFPDIRKQEHWVVEKLFVAFITKYFGLTLDTPWTFFEDPCPLFTSPIR